MLILTNSTIDMTSPGVQFQSNYAAANIQVELSSRDENLNILLMEKIPFIGDMILLCIILYFRGGEWCFKNHGSRKIFAEIHGSRSLVFNDMCVSQS